MADADHWSILGDACKLAQHIVETAPSSFVTYSDSLAFKATGVTKSQVETACKEALSKTFKVDQSFISLTITESRRLADVERRLAGTWQVEYEIRAPASLPLGTHETAADEFATLLRTELVNAGADESTMA